MNILVFDTETTSLNKPFCYNVGYTVVSIPSGSILCRRDFIIEQIWHNISLFSTAYYAEKRPIYVKAMRSKKCVMDKWGYVMRQMKKDIKTYKVKSAYAYNSPFDDSVFTYNCDWFKTNNPLETIPIYDIRGYAIEYIVDAKYKAFCDANSFYTDMGNYSTTAEMIYRYLTSNPSFEESHTALSDAEIETTILLECLARGATIDTNYKIPRSVPRIIPKHFVVKESGKEIFSKNCTKITVSKDKQTITLI